MKTVRHQKILDIITSNKVATQEELQALLSKEGFVTTQATISRDIRELRLIKSMSPSGGYCYATPQETVSVPLTVSLSAVFIESIRSVDYAGNFVVVKCHSGMANAVCATIDTGKWDGLVGTLAGDDTIFLLMRNEDAAKEFSQYITEITLKNK